MFYRNDSLAAAAACERERTGNFGADEYKNSHDNITETFLPDYFYAWKEKNFMNSPNYNCDSRLYEIKDCKILKDLTPDRDLSEKIYLCKCNLCGNTFTRCRKTLVFHHSDCGCLQQSGFRSGMHIDKLILSMDNLSKKVFYAKLNVLGNPNISDVFKALYMDGKNYSEYTALDLGMSMATLYRSRKQIHKLWLKLKNELMEK